MPDARVHDLDPGAAVRLGRGHDPDVAARVGELDRVAHEVAHDLADARRVVADPERAAGEGAP